MDKRIDGRTEGRTDRHRDGHCTEMTKLIAAFCNFVNLPIKVKQLSKNRAPPVISNHAPVH